MLQPTYSLALIIASLTIATLASYTSLHLTGRIATVSGKNQRLYWLTGGAIAMGLGIWCMHFVGMLSFSLPIPLGYDFGLTAASLVIAVLVSFFALHLVTREKVSLSRLFSSGIMMGAGIAAMHYTGMAAMRMNPAIQWHPGIFTLSILIAVGASTAALWLMVRLRHQREKHLLLRRIVAALVMGIAITGMHYTGMAAADFPLGSVCTVASEISPNWLALTIAGLTFGILTITLMLSILDARLEMRTNEYVKSLTTVNAKLHHQAMHDALTGLPNRSLLFERVRHALVAAERARARVALYFIDLDGFKAINDSLGHAVGDALLQEVAARLQQSLRKEDTVARLGGDEFVILVEGLPDVGMAGHIAEKLLECFHDEFVPHQLGMRISPSIGIAIYPDDGKSVDELISHADAAMYEVKTSGRNNYRFFEAAMNASTRRAIDIQRSLPAAIQNDELFLVYQPKFSCDRTHILGAEALLRWRHPKLGMISPAEFIPIAERSGQILEVGRWVIEEVCRQLQEWQTAGLETVRIAINLSQIQMRSARIVEDILGITVKHQIAPAKLMFEITETVAMQNAVETMQTIEKLQQAGFELAIDDFGTGYSSLSYLQQFGVQQMKVDRSFIHNMAISPKGYSIVVAIIQLAHSLGIEVVAEGVETEEQLSLLQDLDCDQTQGYLHSPPLEGNAFIDLLNQPFAPVVGVAA
ncbi:diguanylate cyclase/phosphodiesterase [Paucimonas lemoignei]|uniref:Diguanylate cyclase/phosphodiesterase n=1 Tax=Paucimonas lemoignei TaxID=29443 RepID=A0A4R3HQ87_PAULE|nr:EAL domain-containing protein [Paucimonas lemoignei]TCS33736.1 diguanylate cyclase/phosphodiesterase [Paucimonas lemoignei]